jgi:hypothetical protein
MTLLLAKQAAYTGGVAKQKCKRSKNALHFCYSAAQAVGDAFVFLLRSPSFCFISGYARPPACEAKNKARRFCYLFSI